MSDLVNVAFLWWTRKLLFTNRKSTILFSRYSKCFCNPGKEKYFLAQLTTNTYTQLYHVAWLNDFFNSLIIILAIFFGRIIWFGGWSKVQTKCWYNFQTFLRIKAEKMKILSILYWPGSFSCLFIYNWLQLQNIKSVNVALIDSWNSLSVRV
jgi:hypothetical protein